MKADAQPVYHDLAHLQRRFRPGVRRTRGFLDAAPFVDVVLLLLLFLLLQSAFVIQPGIRVDLPAAAFTDGASYRSMVVTLSREGLVFFNDELVRYEELPSAFERALRNGVEPSLLVEADASVRHDALVEVFTMASEAGVRDVVLATRLPAPEP